MSELLNSITFSKKTEMDLFHKQIDLLLELNKRLKPENWETEAITMKIDDDGEFVTLSWCQCFDGESIEYIDPYHCVERSNYSAEYLDIEEDGKYCLNIGNNYHLYEIDGKDIINLAEQKQEE